MQGTPMPMRHTMSPALLDAVPDQADDRPGKSFANSVRRRNRRQAEGGQYRYRPAHGRQIPRKPENPFLSGTPARKGEELMLRATCLTRADRGNGLAGKARSHRTAIWSMIPAVTYAKMKRRPCRPFRHA